MRRLLATLCLMAAVPLAASTTNNDDSCDIGMYPAATLLLPFFEVDTVAPPGALTTIFSVTNVSPYPQIAKVTIWSDWAFPVMNFNIFLTGYDVQAVNLYDVIVRGVIAPPGTSASSPNARTRNGTLTNPYLGVQPGHNLSNPNFATNVSTECSAARQPVNLPANLIAAVRGVLTTGVALPSSGPLSCNDQTGARPLGDNHGNIARGYLTIDVVATCSATFPTQAQFFNELLFDNVLTGDYQYIAGNATTGNYAGGSPLVHVRAIPEGGAAGSIPIGGTRLPYTFYDRITTAAADRRIDRRQPLPATFAARWIAGSGAGFETNFKIWREAVTAPTASCSTYANNSSANVVSDLVRFDERENANSVVPPSLIFPFSDPITLPAAAKIASTSNIFPANTSTDVGGWMYMNLSNNAGIDPTLYTAARPGFGRAPGMREVSQNWVVVSMFAEGRFGVDFDATQLGNGCSPPVPHSSVANDPNSTLGRIGPTGGVILCPPGTFPTNGDTRACIGNNTNP